MSRHGDAFEHAGAVPGVATVLGHGQSVAEVAVELMDLLADDPRVVECDLAGIAAPGTDARDAFWGVDNYLAQWPGPVVMVHVPNPSLRLVIRSVASTDRLLLHSSREDAVEHRVLPSQQCHRMRLAPVATAPRTARAFVTRQLLDWGFPHLVGGASQVVSELVNAAVPTSAATMGLTVSKVEDRVRIALRDDGPSPAEGRQNLLASTFSNPGLHLMMAFAESWDVIPARSRGKTVWAVLDGTRVPVGATASRTVRRDLHRRVQPGTGRPVRARRRQGRGLGNVVPMWPRG